MWVFDLLQSFFSPEGLLAPLILGFGGGGTSTTVVESAPDVSQFMQMKVPSASELKLTLTKAIVDGKITPVIADEILQQRTELEGLAVDHRLEDAQYEALAQLQVISQQGFTIADKARINNIFDQSAAKARGAREAIVASARSRGIGGSGIELGAQQRAQQASAQDANRFYSDLAAAGLDNSRQATQALAQAATGMRSQDFNEQAKVAEAQDAINALNTKAKLTIQESNINRDMAAQAANLARETELAKFNAGVSNQEAAWNANIPMMRFQAEMELAKGKSGAFSKGGSQSSSGATTKQPGLDEYGRVIGAAGEVYKNIPQGGATNTYTGASDYGVGAANASQYGSYGGLDQWSDSNAKQDVDFMQSFDTGKFLQSLSSDKDSDQPASLPQQTSIEQGTPTFDAPRASGGGGGAPDTTMQDIGAIVGIIGTVAMMFSDEEAKTDKKEFDPHEFISSLTGYKYNYKPGYGDPQARHAGVMAQDLEKTDVGRGMVTDTPAGKMVDTNQLASTFAAVLANMNDRLEKVEGGKR